MHKSWIGWHVRLKAHKKAMASKPKDEDLAAEVGGIGRAGLNHWLNGTRPPTINDFFALCDVLNADPKEILFGADGGKKVASTEKDDPLLPLSDYERGVIEALREVRARTIAPQRKKATVRKIR